MIRRRILYVMLLIVLFHTILLYNFPGLRLLLVFLLLLPFAGMLTLLATVGWIRTEFIRKRIVVTRGRSLPLRLGVINRSLIPVAQMKIVMEKKDGLNRDIKSLQRLYGLDGREKREIKLDLSGEHCGRMEYYLRKVRVYDYLGICAWTIRRKQKAELWVLPRVENLDGEELKLILQEGTGFAQYTDDGDAYEIRDYSMGDRLHRVHWKLSARMEELQIRESNGHGGKATLFLLTDFRTGPEEEQQKEWDAYLDRAISLLVILYEAELLEGICWSDSDGLQGYKIAEREDITAGMIALMSVTWKKTEEEDTELFGNPGWLYLNRDRRLYCGEQCLYE